MKQIVIDLNSEREKPGDLLPKFLSLGLSTEAAPTLMRMIQTFNQSVALNSFGKTSLKSITLNIQE